MGAPNPGGKVAGAGLLRGNGRRLFLRWAPLLLWMALIFVMSAQSKQDIPSFGLYDLLVKKGSHFLAYALLAWLALRAVDGAERAPLLALIIAATYAASDEWHQSFVPGRNAQMADVIIDCLGALSALLLARWWSRRRQLGGERSVQ